MKNLPINSCEECPFLRVERYYTADSWEVEFQGICTKTTRPSPPHTDKMKRVKDSSSLGFGKEFNFIPDWCPL